MNFRHKPALRIISIIVLAFFTWTFGGGFDIAFAAKEVGSGKSEVRSIGQRELKPEEKFQKAIEDITNTIEEAGKIGRLEDEKKGKLKTKKTEIEGLDVEIKKQFKETEEKIKDLPEIIKQRHRDFVKHYEDNLNELRANLDAIDKAAIKTETDAAIKKAKAHLERVKPPKKHIPLDPNKLPHRTVEPVEVPLEEISAAGQKSSRAKVSEAVIGKMSFPLVGNPSEDRPRTSLSDTRSIPTLEKGGKGGFDKPIMVASIGSLAGLLSSAVVQATNQPTDADLTETIEVQFTPEITAKAEELQHNPVKIYNWVRNNIEFVPTYGSIQGANMCLQTKQCNDFDTASLLIALLRVSGIYARYVQGTIELPIEKVKNWVGGFTNTNSAMTFIASGGIPVKGLTSGGRIESVQMEHIWIEAYIPYGNYRGSMRDDSIKTWIPMDGSYKQYVYTSGIDMTAAVPFNEDEYLSQVRDQNPIHYYQDQIQNYLYTNIPDTAIVDVTGHRAIQSEDYHFLSPTLPYKTVAVLNRYSSVPQPMMYSIKFSVSDDASEKSYTFYTPEIAGKRVTLSYVPSSAADVGIINAYGGYIFDVPAYLLNIKPVVKIDGEIKLTGNPVSMGFEQLLTMNFFRPNKSTESIFKRLTAGAYYAVGINYQGVNETVLGYKNNSFITNLQAESASTLGNDELTGAHLHILALTNFLAIDKLYNSAAKLYNVAFTRLISEGIISLPLDISYIFSVPLTVTPSGIEMDIAMDRVVECSKEGNKSKEKAFMDISGLTGSYHEHDVFERIDGFASVSAVKALQTAKTNGIPVYLINSDNIDQLLPILQVDEDIKIDIRNAVNTGKEVTISAQNITMQDWVGVGYIVRNPATGAGAYMISGGIGGGRNIDIFAQWETFKKYYWKPLEWFSAVLDWAIGNIVAYFGELENDTGGLDDDEIGNEIANGALVCKGMGYLEVGKCTGLVRRAYTAAGIDLMALAKKNGIGDPNMAYNMFALANKLNINHSVRTTNTPLIGDIIFWNYTYDRNKNCLLADDKQPTHVGIVSEVDIDEQGTLTFIHASSKGVTTKNKMNIGVPSDKTKNAILRGSPKNGCPSDGSVKTSGELFSGFGTIRNK